MHQLTSILVTQLAKSSLQIHFCKKCCQPVHKWTRERLTACLAVQGYSKMPLRAIARKLFSYADGCTFSGDAQSELAS